MKKYLGGRALEEIPWLRLGIFTKLRMPGYVHRESDSGSEVPLSRGEQPRSSSKVPKFKLSVSKEVEFLR